MYIARAIAVTAIIVCLAYALTGCGAGQPSEQEASLGTPVRGCPGPNGDPVPCPG